MLNLPGRKDWVIESYNFRILKSRDLVLIHNNFVFIFLGEGTESKSQLKSSHICLLEVINVRGERQNDARHLDAMTPLGARTRKQRSHILFNTGL